MYILCTILISLLIFPIVKCVCIPRCFAQNRCLLVLEMSFDLLFRVYQNFLLVTPKYIWVNKLAIVVQSGTWTLMNNHQCWWTTIRWKQQTRRDRSLHRCDHCGSGLYLAFTVGEEPCKTQNATWPLTLRNWEIKKQECLCHFTTGHVTRERGRISMITVKARIIDEMETMLLFGLGWKAVEHPLVTFFPGQYLLTFSF